jgi:hypothetical protein
LGFCYFSLLSFCIHASKFDGLKLSVCLRAEYSLGIFRIFSKLVDESEWFAEGFPVSFGFTKGS